jgi:hypothetical protein
VKYQAGVRDFNLDAVSSDLAERNTATRLGELHSVA